MDQSNYLFIGALCSFYTNTEFLHRYMYIETRLMDARAPTTDFLGCVHFSFKISLHTLDLIVFDLNPLDYDRSSVQINILKSNL